MSGRRCLSVVLSMAACASLTVSASAGVSRTRTENVGLSSSALARSPELSTVSRLGDRRSFVIGDRVYEVGAEDGRYPAAGFHTRGEMGGFWSMPIKLLDGVWFGVDGSWLAARRYTSGWGYARMDLGSRGGCRSAGPMSHRTACVPA